MSQYMKHDVYESLFLSRLCCLLLQVNVSCGWCESGSSGGVYLSIAGLDGLNEDGFLRVHLRGALLVLGAGFCINTAGKHHQHERRSNYWGYNNMIKTFNIWIDFWGVRSRRWDHVQHLNSLKPQNVIINELFSLFNLLIMLWTVCTFGI